MLNPYMLLIRHIDGHDIVINNAYPVRYTIFHELDIITTGGGRDVVNGKEYQLNPGDVFYRVPGMHNQHFLPFHCYFFVFEPYFDVKSPMRRPREVVQGNTSTESYKWAPISPFFFAKEPYLGRLSNPETVTIRANKIYNEYRSTSPDWLVIRAEFLLMLRDISTQLSGGSANQNKDPKYYNYMRQINKVRGVIMSDVDHKWTLKEAAEIACLSPNFFCKVFHTVCEESFIEFVLKLKIKKAMLLLVETQMSTKEIADKLSFCDVTYFQTLFKKQTGITPGNFRKMIDPSLESSTAFNGSKVPD